MLPIAIIMAVAQHAAPVIETTATTMHQPGKVDTAQLNESLADFAKGVLACYHHTARFRGVDVIGTQWTEQAKYGAEQSMILRIKLDGISGTPYYMDVAAMAKPNAYRTFVIQESTLTRYSKNCSLESWTPQS